MWTFHKSCLQAVVCLWAFHAQRYARSFIDMSPMLAPSNFKHTGVLCARLGICRPGLDSARRFLLGVEEILGFHRL